jgi:beta-lactamase regulating signal transducer with metallopeptidase domain
MMHEHVAPAVYYLEVHLICATVACLAAWVLTSMWNGAATVKYWIWVATSVNFLIPLAGFFNRFGASHVSWATQLAGLDQVGIEISRNPASVAVLLTVWLCGAGCMLLRLLVRLRRQKAKRGDVGNGNAAAAQRRSPIHGVPVTLSAGALGPSVDGILRPYISLPLGIDRLLTERELDAVLLHEVTHARRRDNLIGLVHEIALCGLWFHPLVWLTGFRLAIFRELSCDDSVIASSRATDLVSAMAKLAVPGDSELLRAGAGTFFRHRVARLQEGPARRDRGSAGMLLIVIYTVVFLACMIWTIAHTPSCFKIVM